MLTAKKKNLKEIFEIPAVIAVNSAKPGIGLDIIKPMMLKFFNEASASISSLLFKTFFAMGLPENVCPIRG